MDAIELLPQKRKKMGGAERARLKKLAAEREAGGEDRQPQPASDPPIVELRPTCLVVLPGISYDEWVVVWNSLDQTSRSINWLVGDALAYGEAGFPDQWSQVVDAQYAEQYKRFLWVSSRIPVAERREALSWSAHRETAALESAERIAILDLAESKGWGSREVKDEVRRRREAAQPTYPSNGPPPAPDEIPRGISEDDDSTFGSVEDIEGEAPQEPLQAREPIPATIPATLPPSPAPAPGSVDDIRALIEKVRALAPGFSPDWRMGVVVDAGGQSTAKLTKGEQIAVGMGPSLPCAIVEAALAALLSEADG